MIIYLNRTCTFDVGQHLLKILVEILKNEALKFCLYLGGRYKCINESGSLNLINSLILQHDSKEGVDGSDK